MQYFTDEEGIKIVLNMIKVIQDNKEFLGKIDGQIGDGDHGINMNKGFSLCEQRLDDTDGFTSSIEKLGNVLLSEIGGSMGPLYGSFFLAMGQVSKGHKEITKDIFGQMLEAATQEIKDLGNAKVGDKTILDTLIPAIDSYKNIVANNGTFIEALQDMAVAAEQGYKSTEGLVAKVGRSSRLGERSRGVLDAGATSCYLLLHSMKTSIETIYIETIHKETTT